MSDKQNVRVRFAPSPTGPLHIGGVRTALYNYLFAKKNGGTFILRIEDTDQTRFVPGAEEYIIGALNWCGINYDEGPDVGGEFGPYRQSDRKIIYSKFAEKLVDEGKAYYAFDTAEELEAMRERLKSEGSSSQQYGPASRNDMNNALTLGEEETQNKIDGGAPYVIRVKMPDDETVVVNDLIRGKVEVQTSLLDDKVLFKSDGMPTYHLANIVDDHMMGITHVIRGEEWLPSAPLHILLYQYFGWEAPQFAHLPLLLKPDGNGKLSKRDGDRLGFPVFPLQWTDPKTGVVSGGYREGGYFPEAFINMLALLGWSPGTEQELFTLEELTESFSIDKVGKSGSKFDPAKAKWFNHQYLIKKSNEELADMFMEELKAKEISADKQYVANVIGLIKERAEFVKDFWGQTSFFFMAPKTYDSKIVKKRWKENTPDMMKGLLEVIAGVEDFKADVIKPEIVKYIESRELGMGAVMNALRLVLVGGGFGPDLMMIAEILGKDEVMNRIEAGIQNIKR